VAKRSSRPSPAALTADVRLALVHGEDRFLQQLYIDALADALTKAHGEIETVKVDGATQDAAAALDEARSFGLMTSHRLVVVDNAADLLGRDGVRPMFERYAEAPSDAATLVLRSDTWRPGKLDKIVAAASHALNIKCDAMSDAEARAWSIKRAQKRYGVGFDTHAATQLVELAGADLGRLDAEIAKLAASVGEGGTITRDVVSRMIGLSREEKAWTLQDPILRGDAEAALTKLHELLTVSREPPILLRRALIDLAKKLHAVARAAADGGNPAKPGESIRFWGPSGRATQQAGGRLDPANALRLYERAVDADHRAKTGRGDEVRTLETLALDLAAAVR
jgi:DNA polymerase III subunit delta